MKKSINKNIYAGLLLAVLTFGLNGCKEEQSSPQKETTRVETQTSITEVEIANISTEEIKTTANFGKPIKHVDNNDYSIGFLLVDWDTPISDIPEVNDSLQRFVEVNNTTNHFNDSMQDIITTDSNGKMIYKWHKISDLISVSSRDEKKDDILQNVLEKYDLPNNYTIVDRELENILQFGYVEKYDGEVTLMFEPNGTMLMVTNVK